ncbi:MAG: hypothetical protein RI554_08030 [Trueperaceae bacterium]|nr:hypothetical protein [Trueperaceae bacterium]
MNHYTGGSYTPPAIVHVRRAGATDLVRTNEGEEVVANERLATLHPLAVGDRITIDGTKYAVIKVQTARDVRGSVTHYVGWLR